MSQKLYYYCIYPTQGLIQKEFNVNLENTVFEKIWRSPALPEPYNYGVKRTDIGKVDMRYMSVCLLENNPLKAIALLQSAIRKKIYPLQQMSELLEQKETALQYELAQADIDEAKDLQKRFNHLIDTLETMYTMPEYTDALRDFEQYLKESYSCDFKHRRYSNVVSVEVFTSLTRTNHNDIYRAFAVYDDSSSEHPIITWHGSLEEFETVVKQYVPDALTYTEQINTEIEGIKR